MTAERNESTENAPITGAIIRWNAEKGYGFLRMEDGKEVFCHVNELCSHLRPPRGTSPALQTKVNIGSIQKREKGLAACNVRCEDCAQPDQWELKPVGELILGVRELIPVCINRPEKSAWACPLPQETIKEANAEFRHAKEKFNLWKGELSPQFFEIFGEPQSIRAESEDEIVLVYPHGEKKVNARALYQSKHWNVAATGEWRTDERELTAAFCFKNIPTAKIWIYVATFSIHPALCENFSMLPAAMQEMILPVVKQAIQPPEKMAENRWLKFMESADKRRIAELRQNILSLKSPGEMFVGSRSYRRQEEITAHYGDERWGTGDYRDVQATEWHLTTGARLKEVENWAGKYCGGETFACHDPKDGETAEQIRDALLAEKTKELKEILERAKAIAPLPQDGRLYDLTPEKWQISFSKSWDELQSALEAEWAKEDEEALKEKRAKWETYQAEVTTLRIERENLNAVCKRAQSLRINLGVGDEPLWCSIGEASVEQLQASAASLRKHRGKINGLITGGLEDRGEKEFQTEADLQEALNAPACTAKWYLSGIDPEKLQAYGRKPGEGFGSKIAGLQTYLPGQRGVVGIAFGRNTSRYCDMISTMGITPLGGNSFPEEVRKRETELLGLIDQPDWRVLWVSTKDGNPYKYSIANVKGIADYWLGGSDNPFQSKTWDGTDGSGPTIEELLSAHHFTPEIPARQTDDIKVAPEQTQALFSQKGGRDFQCSCGCMERITKGDQKKYEAGEIIAIKCTGCKGAGELKK